MALMPRAAHVLQWWYNGLPPRERERIHKADLSSDWSLQLDSMKPESLVIAYQQRRGEYVPGPCTHRPSSHGSLGYPNVRDPTSEGAAEGKIK